MSQGTTFKYNEASQEPSVPGAFLLSPRSHENRKQPPSFIEGEPVRAGWDLTGPPAL